jgi:predicted DNA-binding protein YlxM (UPF0122 family)
MYFSGDLPAERNCRVGRPNSIQGERLEELLEVYYSKSISLRELARIYGVSRMTIWRAVQARCYE